MSTRKKILIVDDEKDLCRLLESILESKGYDVFVAGNGEEGLRLAEEIFPDMVISDVLMPVMDGSQFLKKLRESYFGKKTRVLVLTARRKMRDYFEAMNVDGFIEKPFTTDEILACINEIFMRDGEGNRSIVIKRVLLTGRDETCILKMVQALQQEGCHTDFVTSGEQVISKAVMFLPTLIIMEIRMPDMSTNAIIRVLRQMPQFRRVPILLYNHYTNEEKKVLDLKAKDSEMSFFVNTCMDEGASEYLGIYNEMSFMEKVGKYIKRGLVVVIDDDKGQVLMIKKHLEAEGYQVSVALDARTGFDLVRDIRPNLILLDVVMPDVNGYETLSSFKSDPLTKNIPVIMLTIKNSDDEIKKGLGLGADDYIIKPCNLELLTKRINSFLRK